MKILVINPGSTTTKIAVFEDINLIFEHKINHNQDPNFQSRFSKPGDIFDQLDFRLNAIKQILSDNNIKELDAVVGRGGNLPDVVSGTYLVTPKIIETLKNRPLAVHASNLGAALVFEISKIFGINNRVFIVDPVSTDEIEEKHKLTGIPEIKRYPGWHALNQKAVGREYAKSIGKKYEDLNLIIAHLGGGSSFAAHKKGRAINVINAVAGEGPMTPERSGAIPAQALVKLCFSGKKTEKEILHLISGGGGIFAHLGVKDLEELSKKYSEFSKDRKDVIDEMIAGNSRAICSLIPDFEGEKIDQIILTGGVANWTLLVESIKRDLTALNIGISVYPGEKEMEALRDGALRVLNGQEPTKEY
ncbi:MAG TPA: butyrate kinase [Candidatus Pacearchaeota archaeon]|nr:butyrate kinase [Candidatus Pacearchaeota archaeon]HPM08478.1 butyrate kinase [Candidatus Pacearchaeota archaeon]